MGLSVCKIDALVLCRRCQAVASFLRLSSRLSVSRFRSASGFDIAKFQPRSRAAQNGSDSPAILRVQHTARLTLRFTQGEPLLGRRHCIGRTQVPSAGSHRPARRQLPRNLTRLLLLSTLRPPNRVVNWIPLSSPICPPRARPIYSASGRAVRCIAVPNDFLYSPRWHRPGRFAATAADPKARRWCPVDGCAAAAMSPPRGRPSRKGRILTPTTNTACPPCGSPPARASPTWIEYLGRYRAPDVNARDDIPGIRHR